jgi:hypothetical protein
VVHAPSQTEHFYEAFDQRRAALTLAAPVPVRRPAPTIELPEHTSCPCEPPCKQPDQSLAWPWPWRRQHAAIEVADGDFVACEDGDVVHGIARRFSSTPVALCGLHLDQCVLDRPFGARALWAAGLDVVVVEDLVEPSHPDDRSIILELVSQAIPVISSSALLTR